jgi:positive regulator of sigma E activity
MREIGRIVRIEREKLSLVITTDESCATCGGGSGENGATGCKACSLFGTKSAKTIDAINRKDLPLREGDMVVVYLDPKKTIFAAFLLFIFPLLVFLGGYAVPTLAAPPPAESVRIICGVAGFVVAYLLLFLRRLVRKAKDWPEVVEKYEPRGEQQ